MTSEPSLLATLPAQVDTNSRVDPSLPALELQTGERLQRGLLLGRGGMGEVRSCTDTRLGRQLAIKANHGEDPGTRARFVREARIQGQLEHPGIVPVHELGLDDEGKPFFTMKRVLGLTLAEVLAGWRAGDREFIRRFPRRKLLSVVQSLSQTLDFAHARGVVHRDLKPANVMLGDFGEVYLLDWGIAKVLAFDADGAPAPSSPGLEAGATRVGAVLGTPGYMAPEQAEGESAGFESDVWALGAILFEVLTGSPLIASRQVQEALVLTLSPLPSPRERAPHREIPPELDRLCAQALSRDRAARPTARALGERLEGILSGEQDTALRSNLAAAHALTAQAAAQRALDGAGEPALSARREALANIGRALALDADNALAAKTFSALLATPPSQLPPEVTAELDGVSAQARRHGARNALFGYGLLVGGLPLLLLLGVLRWDIIGLWLLPVAAAVGSALLLQREGPTRRASTFLAVGSVMTMNMFTAAIGGPFIVVPVLAMLNTNAFLQWAAPRDWAWVLGAGVLTVAAPGALALLGLGLVSFEGGHGLLIRSAFVELGSRWTVSYLLISSLLSLLAAGAGAVSMRRALTEAQLQLALQRWTLEQLRPRA